MINLKANQKIIVEAGAMAAMDNHVKMESKMRGGFGQSMMRMLGGESIFLSEFTAQQRSGQLYISPGVPGDIQHYYLEGGRTLFLQSSGFFACSPGVELQTKLQGIRKGFFSGESFFLIKAVGRGDVWFSSYGAILEIPIEGGYIIDTGYIVAFEDSLNYNVEILGGLGLVYLAVRAGSVVFRGQVKPGFNLGKLTTYLTFSIPSARKKINKAASQRSLVKKLKVSAKTATNRSISALVL